MTKHELELCIDKYGKDIYSFCKHLTNNPLEADDLYQDTFLRAVVLKEKIEYGNNPKSYFLSIALRIWRNKKRKFAWRKRIADVQPIVDERDAEMGEALELSPEERITSKEKDMLVRTAVSRLPEKLKITVLLFYMEDLSTAQISEVMKIPVGTVLSRLYQARKILKKELEDVLSE
ncbi:MAG: sigma-70 family RNA polymerase sigma factor [Acetatifactor sp.]|nr:sigma-70 family RNA polymerase sigma factor [Acetatifactor sp.]MDE7352196.1 sigma-70 family RNA polymerase sigma factor [Acetatifactor sp.]